MTKMTRLEILIPIEIKSKKGVAEFFSYSLVNKQRSKHRKKQEMENRTIMKLIDEYQVQTIALDVQEDHRYVQLLLEQPGWSVDCEDENIILFTRDHQALSMK